MADNEFLSEFQEKLSNTIWQLVVWALIATFGWGIKTALQVNDLALLSREATEEVKKLESEVHSLQIRMTVLETKLKDTPID